MRERRGALGRATGLAEGVAAVVRRRQQDREPRLVLYDARGISRVVAPDLRGYDHLLETCVQLVEVVAEPGAVAGRAGRTEARRAAASEHEAGDDT
jgi:hypothetical protein